MEEVTGSFDEFSLEMGDYEINQVKVWDRMWNISDGGSMDQYPLARGGSVYFASFNHNLYCLDARTGNLRWKYEARNKMGCSSPIEHEGMIFVGCHDYNMYAIDAESGTLVWKFPTRGEIIGSTAVKDGCLYFGSSDRMFYALDARTGKLIWKFMTEGKIFSEPTIADDFVIFGSFDRQIYCLNRKTGELMWKVPTYREVTNVAPFPVLDGFVYISCYDNFLRKIELQTGRLVWKKRYCQRGFTTAPVIHNGTILLSSEDGTLMAVGLEGRMLWKFSTSKPLGNPTVWKDKIYVGGEDFSIHCLDLSGKVLWSFRTRDAVFWKPAIWNGIVFFSSYDCNVYAADALTGKLLWKFRTEGSPSTYPPPYANFELSMIIPEPASDKQEEKKYDMSFGREDELNTSEYQGRVTYQISTHYTIKRKYQADEKTEGF